MESIIEVIFVDVIWIVFRWIGAFLRWPFYEKKSTFKDVLNKSWNGIIGLLFVALVFFGVYLIF